MRLPQNFAFDLKAQFSSGPTEAQNAIIVQGKVSRRELSGHIRGGGSLLDLRTANGPMQIE